MKRLALFPVAGSDSEVSVVQSTDADHWKPKIIVTCTIAAAIEIIVIIFIVMYWREIRWTMRKISCTCVSAIKFLHVIQKRACLLESLSCFLILVQVKV